MIHRFYRDANGDPRAKTGRDQRLLGRFLETDVQGSKGICEELLTALGDIAAGHRKHFKMTGNAHTLILNKRLARIRPEFGSGPDLVLAPAELRQALQEWKTLLTNTPQDHPG
ncbi:MAG: YacL family protein [Candidatus Aminicenantes bacterium]|nr:YacL family protein [Candidatus Aminicenantes bacterium]